MLCQRCKHFLRTIAPGINYYRLVTLRYLACQDSKEIKLTRDIYIEPFLVPHRDEFSETVGYRIVSQNRSLVYIPDIDKWSKWDQDIFKVVLHTDYALLDGTFIHPMRYPIETCLRSLIPLSLRQWIY